MLILWLMGLIPSLSLRQMLFSPSDPLRHPFQPADPKVQCIRPLSAGLAKLSQVSILPGQVISECPSWPRGKLNTLTLPNSENTGHSPRASPGHQGQMQPALHHYMCFHVKVGHWSLSPTTFPKTPGDASHALPRTQSAHPALGHGGIRSLCYQQLSNIQPQSQQGRERCQSLAPAPSPSHFESGSLKRSFHSLRQGKAKRSILAIVFKEILTLSLSEFLVCSCMS